MTAPASIHEEDALGKVYDGRLMRRLLVYVRPYRGLVLAAPVLYGMYAAGGTWMAIWLGFCSLAGIALSVVAPLFVARRLKLLPARAAR